MCKHQRAKTQPSCSCSSSLFELLMIFCSQLCCLAYFMAKCGDHPLVLVSMIFLTCSYEAFTLSCICLVICGWMLHDTGNTTGVVSCEKLPWPVPEGSHHFHQQPVEAQRQPHQQGTCTWKSSIQAIRVSTGKFNEPWPGLLWKDAHSAVLSSIFFPFPRCTFHEEWNGEVAFEGCQALLVLTLPLPPRGHGLLMT